VKHPALLVADFAALSRGAAADADALPVLVDGFLTSHFSFEQFRGLRPDLAVYDEQIRRALTEPAGLTAQLFPRGGGAGKLDKNSWLRPELDDLRERSDLLDVVCGAALESTPLRKLAELAHGLALARAFFLGRCPPALELGADEFTPISIAYVYIANPPFLLSNLIYLGEMCYRPEFDAVVGQTIAPAAGVLVMGCRETVPDVDLSRLTSARFPAM
jgi:hypothetical protein